MKSKDSNQLLQKVDEAIIKTKDFLLFAPQNKQLEMDSYFAQFLIVYICGLYEEIIENTVTEMAHKLGNDEIENFVKDTLKYSFMNPDMHKITGLFKKFNNQMWIEAIKNLPETNKTALGSIVLNKNSLAHGQSSLNLTISDVETYYKDSKVVLEKIDDLLL